ncbi:MAG: mycofactocin biosynthesis glycosyltransferase MftF [Galbitalea sp.]
MPCSNRSPPVDEGDVTWVIPVRDRAAELARLLESIGTDRTIVVVDDGSLDPAAVAAVAASHGAALVALPANVGPASARNAGLRTVTTTYVVFVDSDVVLDANPLPVLLGHFADPRVAMVAPRIRGLVQRGRDNWIARYEDARSSLDLGLRSATVRPRSPVSWVSSTFLVARVDALEGGFSEGMRVGEDVDLVWNLCERGWRVRYEPAASVRHAHRTEVREWMARKTFYGTGAHPLAMRHPRNIAPAILAPWSAGVLLALLAQRRWSVPLALGISAVAAVNIAGKLTRSEHPLRDGVALTASGVGASLSQGMALLVRHWWPLTVVLALFSRRVRRAAVLASVVDIALEYGRTGARLDPVRFGVARRLDDLAYGLGVWLGALRGRSLAALLPDVRRRG